VPLHRVLGDLPIHSKGFGLIAGHVYHEVTKVTKTTKIRKGNHVFVIFVSS
jgi:hypothetical protein